MRVDGRRVEGPDADWIDLPDPIAEAIQGLASRIGSLERTVAELSGEEGGGLQCTGGRGHTAAHRSWSQSCWGVGNG